VSGQLGVVFGDDLDASDFGDVIGLAEIGAGFFGHVNWGVVLEGKDGEAKFAIEDFGGVAAEADVEGVAVVKIVGDKSIVQQDSGDVAGVMDAEDGVEIEVDVGRNFDAPDGGVFEVGVQRGGGDGFFDVAEGNFSERAGGFYLFATDRERNS
jgi:hypothetical protein